MSIPFVVEQFRWPPGVREKVIRKHGIDPYDVEACFFERDCRARRVGNRYSLLSRTPDGAYIVVWFEYAARTVTVVTAREMTPAERRGFRRK